jgi:hypothetical protein
MRASEAFPLFMGECDDLKPFRLQEAGDLGLGVSKSVPQRLKPRLVSEFTARLKPCPSFREFSVRV